MRIDSTVHPNNREQCDNSRVDLTPSDELTALRARVAELERETTEQRAKIVALRGFIDHPGDQLLARAEQAERERDRLIEAIREALVWLGSGRCKTVEKACEGCAYEMYEVRDSLHALIRELDGEGKDPA